MNPVFHLSLSVSDLTRSRKFYETILDAGIGRFTDQWMDLWLFGTQITIYQRPNSVIPKPFRDGLHFGATVSWKEWAQLRTELEGRGVIFVSGPAVDEKKGQAKMLFADPDGYFIEIKAYRDPAVLKAIT